MSKKYPGSEPPMTIGPYEPELGLDLKPDTRIADLERQLAKAQKTIEKLQRGVRCKQPNCPNPKADRGYCHHHRYLKWD